MEKAPQKAGTLFRSYPASGPGKRKPPTHEKAGASKPFLLTERGCSIR